MSFRSDLPTYHVALSPDGQNVVTLNTVTLEMTICHNLKDAKKINYKGFKTVDTQNPRLCWSLAISNSINLGTHSDTLIGVSCFDRTDVLIKSTKRRSHKRYFSSRDLEEGYLNVRVSPYTWIISTWYQERISTSIDDTGGVIRFLADNSPDTDVVMIHIQGISRTTIKSNYSDDGGKLKSDLCVKLAEHFLFPMIIATDISAAAEGSNPNLQLFQRSVEKNFFMAENYKFDLLEMYSLKTGELYRTFHIREEEVDKRLETHGSAIFEISRNDILLAYCRGTNSISIYLIENSLEIVTKPFPNLYRINSIDFCHSDENLFIIGEEEKDEENGSTELVTVILIWQLFNESENSVIKIENTHNIIKSGKKFSTKQTEHYHRFASASGNIVAVNEETGEVCSIVDHPELNNALNPSISSISSKSKLTELDLQSNRGDVSTPLAQIYHYIYTLDGNFLDAKKESRNIIIGNAEPWVRLKQHPRISAYLNNEKTLQVILSFTTIQVWRRNDSSKYKRRLLYIWTSGRDERFDIQNFKIGNNEFFVELSLPFAKEHHTIHWPHKRSTLRDACKAIEYLNRQRGEPITPNKKQQFRDLARQTRNILKRIINKNPEVWSMADARYEIMQSLILGQCVSLIRSILFKKVEKDDKNPRGISSKLSNHLHFPRIYKWPEEKENDLQKKETDLQIAINSAGDRRKDTIIVGYLLNYYSDNAMINAGWMFTATQVLPELYDRNMDYYIHELFYKPCFGAKEIKIDTSLISRGDLFEGRIKPVHSLYIKPGLKRKPATKQHDRKAQIIQVIKSYFSYERLLEEVEELEETIKVKKTGLFMTEKHDPLGPTTTNVRIVPLPNFTVYTPGAFKDHSKVPLFRKILKLFTWPREYVVTEEANLSPFLRVIGRDSSAALFSNPAMAAVIDYKWASARDYCLRHFGLFVVFALLFSIITGSMEDGVHLKPNANFNPNEIGLTPSGSSYSILNASDSNPDTNNLYPNISVAQSFDVNSVTDNYFSHFWKSVESVFFWINGRWDQLDQWNFIPLDILAIVASILLVMIMQNMLIALMTNAFEEAQSSGEDAVLRHRADLIAEYEILEKPFGFTRKDRRYIYYIGKIDYQNDWMDKATTYRSTHNNTLLGDEEVDAEILEDEDSDEEVSKDGENEKCDEELISKTSLQEKVQGIEDKLEKVLELLNSGKE
ncbi:11209_t:CDS:2 [Gigaspora margarita]|uniref:11209_t:CDS:1 n=1 Tax=Gigaspora margarita TaxID=4874 RepID=A0ABN7UST8_GIGMA|nr:11209_t:CDS:2 [Gigaspora margarita]